MGFAPEFFSATSQLIPVLFLAMAVEDRLQPGKEEDVSDRVIRSWSLALLVTGEVISLAVLAGGIDPSQAAGSIVSSTMVLATFMIVLPALTKGLEKRSRGEIVGHLLAGILVLVVLTVSVVAIQFS